jgi:hypothetical protein
MIVHFKRSNKREKSESGDMPGSTVSTAARLRRPRSTGEPSTSRNVDSLIVLIKFGFRVEFDRLSDRRGEFGRRFMTAAAVKPVRVNPARPINVKKATRGMINANRAVRLSFAYPTQRGGGEFGGGGGIFRPQPIKIRNVPPTAAEIVESKFPARLSDQGILPTGQAKAQPREPLPPAAAFAFEKFEFAAADKLAANGRDSRGKRRRVREFNANPDSMRIDRTNRPNQPKKRRESTEINPFK